MGFLATHNTTNSKVPGKAIMQVLPMKNWKQNKEFDHLNIWQMFSCYKDCVILLENKFLFFVFQFFFLFWWLKSLLITVGLYVQMFVCAKFCTFSI